MRQLLAIALALALAGVASAQTQQLQPAQMPPSPKSITAPKPPVAPTAPRAATQAAGGDVEATAQLALMRAAQDAQADLRSLMAGVVEANRKKVSERGATTSNPCERTGLSAAPSCISSIKGKLARVRLPAVEKSQLEADLTILRDSLKSAQYAGAPKQRESRLAEAKVRADRIDATLARLAEPRAPAAANVPLDKLIPGLVN